MAKLIGTDPNQVPTNGDLGDLAYQNKESVKVEAFESNGIDDNATSTAMTLDSSGNVGIGTSSPANLLHLEAASCEIRLKDTGASDYALIGTDDNGTLSLYARSTNGIIDFRTQNTERMSIDSSGQLSFNSGYGSSAKAYGCRAWVNFDGTGTVAIRGDGNVSSITDNGSGDYTVNFTTAMPDVNYAVKCSGGTVTANLSYQPVVGYDYQTQATGSVRVSTRQNSSPNRQDVDSVSVAIFR